MGGTLKKPAAGRLLCFSLKFPKMDNDCVSDLDQL
jgi:hypothetical protein